MSPRLGCDWSIIWCHSVLHQSLAGDFTGDTGSDPESPPSTPSNFIKYNFKYENNKTFTAAFEKFNLKSVKYFVLNILSPNSTFPSSWLPSSDPPERELKWNICKEQGPVTFYWSESGQYICTQERTREKYFTSQQGEEGEVNKIYFNETWERSPSSFLAISSPYRFIS